MESKKSSFLIFSSTERAKEKIQSFDGCLFFEKGIIHFGKTCFFGKI